MKSLRHFAVTILLIVYCQCAGAQQEAILKAPPEDRMRLFWHYCASALISDRDSVITHRFLNNIMQGADSLGDRQLKAYAQYFQKCWRILFSERYETHFPDGYMQAADLLHKTQTWALEQKYPDIAASCEHYTGHILYRANCYGQAFEHLLKADAAFERFGYQHVPNASEYLYTLGLYFYRFEEYDRALQKLLQAANYTFYAPYVEINTLNTIGLIYARYRQAPEKAIQYFRNTIAKAVQDNNITWIGIAAGNLGNVLLAEHQYDSALFYHRKNFVINSNIANRAPEDAAKTTLSMATIFLRKGTPDSALFYMQSGKELAAHYITDSAESLDYHVRLLRVMIDYAKTKGEFRNALLLSDSLSLAEQALRSMLDSKILSRAVEKTEAQSYSNKLALLQSQKNLAQWRSYVIIALLLIILIVSGAVFRDRWLRRKRQIQLAEKDKQLLVAEKARAEDGLKHAEELLKAYVDAVKEKTTIIEHLESEVAVLKSSSLSVPELQAMTSNREKLLASTILTEGEWQQFRSVFEQVYPGFSYRLKQTYPELSPAEARFLYLMKLHLSSREMAAMLGITVETIHKLRYRLRKKLNLEEAGSFEGVIQNIS